MSPAQETDVLSPHARVSPRPGRGRGGKPALLAVLLLLLLILPGCGKTPPPRSGDDTGPAPLGNAQRAEGIGVQGKGGRVDLPSGETRDLVHNTFLVPERSLLALFDRLSTAKLIFPFGGIADISGRGTITLKNTGFAISDGTFISVFRKTSGGQFRVKIPCGTLGILGTRISFALKNGQGQVRLLEGKAEFTPDDPGKKPMMLVPGGLLRLQDTRFQMETSPGRTGTGADQSPLLLAPEPADPPDLGKETLPPAPIKLDGQD